MKQTVFWALHILCAVIMVLLLGVHMAKMHLSQSVLVPHTGNLLAWESVLSKSKSIAGAIAYTALLGTGLYHGLYGVRNIIFELGFSKKLERCIDVFLLCTGIGLFAVGTIATVAIKIIEIQ